MKSYFRNILKRILGILSQRTIAKHNAEVIVITGWTGTSIVRELVYHMLEEEFNVRRNVTEVWWDFSVPLTILGYEDKKRSVFSWIKLILRTFYCLRFKPKYPHKIIINLDTCSEDTAKFWSTYINPHIVVILRERPKSKVIEKIVKKEGSEKILFVYNPDLFEGLGKSRHREFIYSTKGGDLAYQLKRDLLKVQHKKEKINVKVSGSYKFIFEMIPPALSVGILEGIALEELSSNLTHFNFHPQQLQNVFKNLKKFVHSDEK
jgi:hypothetical protein